MPSRFFVDVVTNNIPETITNIEGTVANIVQAVIREGEFYMKTGMRDTPKTGNVYVKGGVVHISSSPGNFPAIDTSALINSVNAKQVSNLVWELRWGTEYAALLEFGSPGGKLMPRPSGLLTTNHLLTEAQRIANKYIGLA